MKKKMLNTNNTPVIIFTSFAHWSVVYDSIVVSLSFDYLYVLAAVS